MRALPDTAALRAALILPRWPAPARVRAASTTRAGGVSEEAFQGLNLGDHVGDSPAHVAANRRALAEVLGLPAGPPWLDQVHGATVAAAEAMGRAPVEADAIRALEPGQVCAVLTADCLPVLLCDDAGTRVAAAHAGWRGLAAGVLEATVAALELPPAGLMAWLGPAIGPADFEVGGEVREAFLARDPGCAGAFRPSPAGRWLADLYLLARRRLETAGVGRVYGGGWSTFADPRRFYSYRRDGRTGRMATLIWLEP